MCLSTLGNRWRSAFRSFGFIMGVNFLHFSWCSSLLRFEVNFFPQVQSKIYFPIYFSQTRYSMWYYRLCFDVKEILQVLHANCVDIIKLFDFFKLNYVSNFPYLAFKGFYESHFVKRGLKSFKTTPGDSWQYTSGRNLKNEVIWHFLNLSAQNWYSELTY